MASEPTLSLRAIPGFVNLQGALSAGKDAVESLQARGKHFQDDLSRKAEVTYGHARDAALSNAYALSSSALATSSSIARRAGALTHLSALDRSAQRLASCSDHWSHREARLHTPPIPEYDTLNVSAVREALSTLSHYDLLKTREYEAANKNRVTVLRDVDRRLK